MAKALNIGVTAWSPLAGGVLTGKYHGHGRSSASPSEPGRMNHDMAKGFMPERERTDRILVAVKSVSDETGRSMAQVALALKASPSTRAGHSDHRRAEAVAVPGQFRELRSDALVRSIEDAGRGKRD